MIDLGLVDYLLVGVVSALMMLRILSDSRDVAAARATKNTMKAIVRKKFSPKLTVIIPLESVDDTKQTLRHFQEFDYPIGVIVVVDSSTHPRAAGALRYFIRKNSMKFKVVAKRQLDVQALTKEHVRTSLVAVLPDTAKLGESFYTEAVLPLGDSSVDGVQTAWGLRLGNTITSALAALFVSVRQFSSINSWRRNKGDILTEGMIVRARCAKSIPKRGLRTTKTRSVVYTVSSSLAGRGSGLHAIRQSVKALDYALVAILTALFAILLSNASSFIFMLGVVAIIHIVLMWWVLGVQRMNLVDKMSVLLLSPLYYPLVWIFLLVATVSRVSTVDSWVGCSSTDTI